MADSSNAATQPAQALRHVIVKYAVVGVVGTLVHAGSTIGLVELVQTPPVTASVMGFILTVLVSFLLNSYWTFATTDRPLDRLARYTVVSVAGLGLNTAIMYSAVEWLQFNYLIGLALVVLVIPPFNFTLNLLWSFRSSS